MEFKAPVFEGEMSSYTPTLRERAQDWLSQNWYGDNRSGMKQARFLTDVLDYTPVGFLFDSYDAGRAGAEGDYAKAGLLAAAALSPLPSALERKGIKTAEDAVENGIRAYHSSPYDFENFDLGRAGTGSGANVYGTGIYASGDRSVSDRGGKYWQQFWGMMPEGPEKEAIRTLADWNFDKDKAVKSILGRREKDLLQGNDISQYEEMLSALSKENLPGPRTYELNIKATPDQLLDYDAPISQQSQIIQDFANANAKKLGWATEADLPEINAINEMLGLTQPKPKMVNDVTGGELYYKLRDMAGGGDRSINEQLFGGRKASAELNNAGIRALRYSDSGVPGDKINYVVFDPSTIEIIRKYGIAGLLGGGALAMGAGQDQAQAQESR